MIVAPDALFSEARWTSNEIAPEYLNESIQIIFLSGYFSISSSAIFFVAWNVPEILDDKDMLQDLLTVAVNEAIKKVDDEMNKVMNEATGGMRMPGMF